MFHNFVWLLLTCFGWCQHRFSLLRSRYRGRHAGGKALRDDPNNGACERDCNSRLRQILREERWPPGPGESRRYKHRWLKKFQQSASPLLPLLNWMKNSVLKRIWGRDNSVFSWIFFLWFLAENHMHYVVVIVKLFFLFGVISMIWSSPVSHLFE